MKRKGFVGIYFIIPEKIKDKLSDIAHNSRPHRTMTDMLVDWVKGLKKER